MKRSLTTLSCGALVALLLSGASARAAFIEWTYNWSPSTSKVFAGSTGTTSGVSLSNEPQGTAAGSSDIVATNIDAFSDAPRDAPEIFGDRGDFSLKLHLTDKASGVSADLTFGGKFTGPISSESADIDLSYTTPETLLVTLGDNEYEVKIGPYSPPGPPGSTNSGSIAAHVSARPASIEEAPEPSTMMLSCLGLSIVGYASWRRKRKVALAGA